MALTKDQKTAVLSELKDSVKGAQAIAFVNFDGLSVSDTTAMRNELREAGVSYKVVKKSLLRITLEGATIEGEIPPMDGNIAIAWSSEDLTAPARGVYNFAKGHEDNLKIVGGVFEGKFMDEVAMNEIATIPDMKTLRGMFVNVINSPIQGFVVALDAIAEKKA